MRVNQERIAQFNHKHGVTEDQQFKQLIEEMGELSEAYNTEAGDDAVAEELADIVFVARSLAECREISLTRRVNQIAAENAEKDESTEGQKVTKAGMERLDDGEYRCSECGSDIDEYVNDENEKMPSCPECGGNPLPAVGGD